VSNDLAEELSASASSAPYPVIRALIKHKKSVTAGGAAAIAFLGFWLALRTGFPEIYAFALMSAAVVYAVLRAAIEVVELVAETLMPR
jgi:hypothetical protein